MTHKALGGKFKRLDARILYLQMSCNKDQDGPKTALKQYRIMVLCSCFCASSQTLRGSLYLFPGVLVISTADWLAAFPAQISFSRRGRSKRCSTQSRISAETELSEATASAWSTPLTYSSK